ncbi:hypothetical protein ABZ215_13540 [Amycolatopsis sp. NPDC006131]|uniref:hypothetical protein n=1 Tax=Amycolatopsis sp. NPDC006131 TaxID=3156731 RepID=UPI0033B6E3B4
MSGPLFDGRADLAVRDYLDAVEERVAGQASAEVHTNLNASIRNPTPYYETQVQVVAEGDAHVVNDRGVIYGPWLEGVGSRNKTTRFKGYFSFRRAAHATRQKAPQLAREVLARFVGRMN